MPQATSTGRLIVRKIVSLYNSVCLLNHFCEPRKICLLHARIFLLCAYTHRQKARKVTKNFSNLQDYSPKFYILRGIKAFLSPFSYKKEKIATKMRDIRLWKFRRVRYSYLSTTRLSGLSVSHATCWSCSGVICAMRSNVCCHVGAKPR